MEPQNVTNIAILGERLSALKNQDTRKEKTIAEGYVS
jgi:hypothetical protein